MPAGSTPRRVCSRPSVGRDGGGAASASTGSRRSRCGRRAAQLGLGRAVGERAPTDRRRRRRARRRSCSHCSSVSSAEWLPGMPLGRQPPRLDRVGEDHRRAVGRPRRPARTRRAGSRRSWPPRSRIAPQQLGVVEVARSTRADVAPRRGRCPAAARAARRPVERSSRWYSSLVISSIRRAQRLAARAREQLAQPAPVLDRDRLPAGGLEHRREPAGGDVRHDPVERLAVQVDDPEHLAEARHDRVDERLPARALVELGVAERARSGVRPAAPRNGRRRSGARARSRSAPSRRSRPTRSRSRPGPDPSAGSDSSAGRRTARSVVRYSRVEPAEEVLDRVQHRRGVRLDRDPVGRAQVLEPQRGHDRHHRRRRRLVAADLHPRARLRAPCWRGGRSTSPATAPGPGPPRRVSIAAARSVCRQHGASFATAQRACPED